ncbi:helix-turn-helix domain-containing protein [Bacillus sp. 03113]|uniref:helix-turn-helix domain-containing protein n=1 Tax=Bacillus sp. 03113 TaxID=2578211 RepID=UPI0011448889|nr:helix-turn-helix transcriptional regulator [Bacillus sp. 03113]
MSYGELLSQARKRQGMTQEDVSIEINYSRESVAKYETGTRKMPKDVYPKISQSVDDPQFYFESWENTTGYVSIPFFNGEYIDQHPSSMHYLVSEETEEALRHLSAIRWSKPALARSESEREEMKKALLEVLDAAASMINLVACICKEYKFSMREIFQIWRGSLKIRKFNK